MSDGISHDEHVQQNNQRLVSVKNSLVEQSTFENACSELTNWCSDHRAFNICFEDNLLAALQVAVENGTKEGYNFPLAHTLISTCFTHRKRLSKAGANRIGRWYEQFRRLKKSGGKKGKGGKKPAETSTVSVVPLAMDTGLTVTESGNMWNVGPHIAGPSPMQSPGYAQQGMMPQQMNGYGMPNGQYPVPGGPMDPNGHRPYMNEYEQHQQQQMMHQRMMLMQQQQQQMQAQAAQAQAQAAAAAPAPAPRRRGRQNNAAAAAAAAAQAQAQQQAAPPGYDGMYQQVPMGANMVPGQVQPLMRVPSQSGMLSPAYPGNPMQQRPGMPMTSPAYPQGAHPQMIRAGPPVMFGQIAQNPQQQRVYSMPNTGHPGMPAQNSLPANLPQYSEPTPTIWMQRSPIMQPYMIPHELNTVTQEFHITEEQKNSLRNSSNCDVILKAFVKEDFRQQTQWPKSQQTNEINISITLNDWPVPINNIHRMVLVKDFINVGVNTVKFMAQECVCRHLFMMYFAEKTPVSAISYSIMQSMAQRTNADICKQKLVRYASSTGGCVRVPLFCGYTRKRLSIPARTIRCQHPQCFDLDGFLVAQQENLKFECPFCPVEMGAARCFGLQDVEIDMFLGHMLAETNKLPQQPTEIMIYANGHTQFAQGMNINAMNHNMNNAMPMNPTDVTSNGRPNSRKRTMEDTVPMKRIKSEPMSVQNQNGLSGPPTSVPGALPSFSHSPSSMVSPFAGTMSPNKGMASPAGTRFPGGPGTPQTPGLHGYPAQSNVVKIEAPDNYQASAPTSLGTNMQNGPTAGATAPVPIGSGTSVSPHQTAGPIQQNGSVETPSLTGSAPYTPASLSNGISSTHYMVEIKHSEVNVPATSITDILEMDLQNPFSTCVLSPEDFPRYLYDAENAGFDSSVKQEISHDDSINDVFDLIKTNRI